MDLDLDLRRSRRHAPDWVAAAVSGFAAGALLMVLELIWAATVGGEGPWRISNLVAAITLGPATAQSSAFSVGVVGVALITHYVLGIVFGLVLAWLIGVFHRESSLMSVETIGTTFGALLYLLNFHGMSALFPWIAELRGWSTFIAHLVFGLAAALLYWRLRRPLEDG
jgi:hypothetical protein